MQQTMTLFKGHLCIYILHSYLIQLYFYWGYRYNSANAEPSGDSKRKSYSLPCIYLVWLEIISCYSSCNGESTLLKALPRLTNANPSSVPSIPPH